MSLSFDLGDGRHLEICVKTSPRAKRLRLVSGIEGVRAVVPPDFSSNELTRFVTSKRDWLWRTSRYYERLRDRCGGFDRSDLLYQGVRYRSVVVADKRFSATVSDALRTITFHVPDKRKASSYLEEWFKQQTYKMIEARLPMLAARMNAQYNKVSVKNQKSRWGSCSKKGNLNFNQMLAAAPPAVLDYVMIHELAHVSVLDHSPRFWAIVQAADPEYKSHREWLSSFAPLIKVG